MRIAFRDKADAAMTASGSEIFIVVRISMLLSAIATVKGKHRAQSSSFFAFSRPSGVCPFHPRSSIRVIIEILKDSRMTLSIKDLSSSGIAPADYISEYLYRVGMKSYTVPLSPK